MKFGVEIGGCRLQPPPREKPEAFILLSQTRCLGYASVVSFDCCWFMKRVIVMVISELIYYHLFDLW